MTARDVPPQLYGATLVGLLPGPLRERFVRLLMAAAQPGRVEPGEVVFRIDETNTDMGFVLLEGAAKITRSSGEVYYLEAPDILGEVQLFTPQARRTATVEAMFAAPVLTFAWQELGAAARNEFTASEMTQLRDAIRHSAGLREANLLTSLRDHR